LICGEADTRQIPQAIFFFNWGAGAGATSSGRLYARLHRSDVGWFNPIRQQLMESQLLTAAECDWAGCLWLLPRLQRNLVAALGPGPGFMGCLFFELFYV